MAEATGSSGLVDIKIEIKEEPVFVEASTAESEELDHTDDPLKEEIKDEEEVDVDLLKDEIIVGEPSCSSEEASRLVTGMLASPDPSLAAFFVSTTLENDDNTRRNHSPNGEASNEISGNFQTQLFPFTEEVFLEKLSDEKCKKVHKCEICGKSFAQAIRMKQHMMIHDGIKPYQCDLCGKGFTQASSMKKHSLLHEGIKPHQCEVCGKCFTTKSLLKQHRFIHEGIRPYKCETCGKSFNHVSNLRTHSLIHSGTKKHKCEICGKGFVQAHCLKRHILIHSSRKVLKCEFCGKCFSNEYERMKHILSQECREPSPSSSTTSAASSPERMDQLFS